MWCWVGWHVAAQSIHVAFLLAWSVQFKYILLTSSLSRWIHHVNFSSSIAPFTSWVRNIWVEGHVGWRFVQDHQPCQAGLKSFIAQDTWRSLSGHSHGLKCRFAFRAISLYKPILLPFIFYFSTEIYDQSTFVTLARQTKPSSRCTRCCSSYSSVPLFWWAFLSFHLKNFFFLHFKFVLPLPTTDIRVLGLTVARRTCLLRQVTNHLFVIGRATRKCTYQVTMIMKVKVKREVCLPLLRPQKMRIWRWMAQKIPKMV